MDCPVCKRKSTGLNMLHWYDKVQPEHCIWCAPEWCYICYFERTMQYKLDNDVCYDINGER